MSMQLTTAALLKDVVAIDPAAEITPSGYNQPGQTRYKDCSFTNFITAVGFSSNIPVAGIKKLFVDPYHYHHPIALKLIFPEHYFW